MRAVYREEPCRTALNRVKGMSFKWSLNPYVGCVHRCTFCYVRGFEVRAGRPGDARYGTSIRVKLNIVDVLRRELARKSWAHELVAFGSATDPYQPVEGRYRLTRECIEALIDFDTPLSLITRGPMVIRDADVLAEASRRTHATVTLSIPTLDEQIWRTTEPATAHPRQRLRAITRLREAGINAGVGMAPLLPGLSDDPRLMAEVVRAARDAGATHLWWNVLNLRPGTKEHFLEALARDWPEQLDNYTELYGDGAYLGREVTAPIDQVLKEMKKEWPVVGKRPSMTVRGGTSRRIDLPVVSSARGTSVAAIARR
jgi:DNA repair photolyase